ncbi:glycosyltransferase family 4 protein [Microbacterium atlanticum]|uniref:glycosyltransferase family 4 protein n=1 Tax=Microbacterium atlanticum TaxID=2782168 RepID=UPI0018879183
MGDRWLVILTELAGVTESTGGVGRRYAAMLPRLRGQGVDPVVLLFPDSPLRDGHFTNGIIVRAWPSRLPRPLRLLVRAAIAWWEVVKLRPAVVVSPEWQGVAALAPRRAALVTNLVTSMRIINEHTASPAGMGPARRLTNRLQIALEDLQVRRSKGAIACSSAIANWARDLFPGVDLAVVRNCIDVDTVRALSRESHLPAGWPAESNEPSVLFVGRLEARKGAPVAALAAGHLGARMPNVHFIFAGGRGDTRREAGPEELMALAGPHTQGRVHFLGDVRGPELFRAMAQASVVTCPSAWEAFGNVVLEAKASGTPVSATSGSGFDDFCTDGVDSVMSPPGDAHALAVAWERVLNDPALADRISHNAAAQVDDFSAARVAADFVAQVRRWSNP